jgi:hypothetical protein
MREQTAGKETSQLAGPGWFNWIGEHPGVVLLGALVVATLALENSPEIEDIERDPTGEEVPLFI